MCICVCVCVWCACEPHRSPSKVLYFDDLWCLKICQMSPSGGPKDSSGLVWCTRKLCKMIKVYVNQTYEALRCLEDLWDFVPMVDSCQEANAPNRPWDQLMSLPAPRDAKRLPSCTHVTLGQNWHIGMRLGKTKTCQCFASNTFSSKMNKISYDLIQFPVS